MRVLLLLRGSAGCGKSTWIREHGLSEYSLCADDIRLMCGAPVLTPDGGRNISQRNDKFVWNILFEMLENRMAYGDFTVIDATNSKTSEMNRYKTLGARYKYRIYCVDFTDIPVETVKERNRGRDPLKRVPDYVIDRMYSRFQTQKIPSGITVIKPDELDKIWMKPSDFSAYGKIHHIGDIHGCYTALSEYFNREGGMKDDEMYIFCGDYIDRGIENAEVLRFLLSIYDKPNVRLLEGNHEKWLDRWANGEEVNSQEFESNTRAQLESSGIRRKDVRLLYRKLGQCAYYTYGDRLFLVTHGGLSVLPQNLTLVSSRQMIHGVGDYNDTETVANTFPEQSPENCYQIFGHRNTKSLPARVNDRVFVLEGKVEFGGCLRCVQVLPGGIINTVEIQNTVFAEPNLPDIAGADEEKTVGDVIRELRANRYIAEKRYGNISSFNFTKEAFYDKVWDGQTIHARGLYINIPEEKVVARAYDKFFNINERPETKLEMLQFRFEFPVTAYVKENGFLGIVSYSDENDDLFITTKSAPDGEYAVWLKEMFFRVTTDETRNAIKHFAKEHNVSFVFECVDTERDRHIISYPESGLYLLDIVFNDLHFRKYEYDEMCEIAERFGLRHKEKARVIERWPDFFDWYNTVNGEDYLYRGRRIEGFVTEDGKGAMLKIKLAYYRFWKFMRSVARETFRKGYIDNTRVSALATPLANRFYGWLKELRATHSPDELPDDICTLREMFYKSDAGRQFAE